MCGNANMGLYLMLFRIYVPVQYRANSTETKCNMKFRNIIRQDKDIKVLNSDKANVWSLLTKLLTLDGCN